MASAVFTFVSVCAGGCHVTINAALDGGANRQLRLDVDQIRAPFTGEEIDDLLISVLRLKARGATRAQARTALQNGFTATI